MFDPTVQLFIGSWPLHQAASGNEVTAFTVPVRPAKDSSLRPLRWRRMAWVTWRHHRIALAGVVAFLGALSTWLWVAGLQVHHAYIAAIACHPAGSPACTPLILNFHLTSGVLKTGFPLQPAPALIGAFIGAPMLAREIETGTFRYAWTQGFGRWRWALAKLVIVGVATAAIAGAFSVLLAWYYQPYFATSNGTQLSSASPLSPGLFDLRGVAFAAWTLAAFAIGALAGMLTRRVVPAIVATLASYTILAVLAGIVIGHTAWADHHPASHFWPLQWIEGGILLTLSTLLVAITVWLVQRRAV